MQQQSRKCREKK